MNDFLVVNIGCIECGVSSKIVGRFSSEQKANECAEALDRHRDFSWREGGQNSYEVFATPAIDTIDPEYILKDSL